MQQQKLNREDKQELAEQLAFRQKLATKVLGSMALVGIISIGFSYFIGFTFIHIFILLGIFLLILLYIERNVVRFPRKLKKDLFNELKLSEEAVVLEQQESEGELFKGYFILSNGIVVKGFMFEGESLPNVGDKVYLEYTPLDKYVLKVKKPNIT